jgi:hypothetical protein
MRFFDFLKRLNKDYYGGALMVIIGLASVYAAIDYHVGTLTQMGPGFFPMALGVLLAIIGALIAFSARGGHTGKAPPGHGHGHGLPDLRGGVCIIAGTLAFMLFGHYGGLLPATFAVSFISALGDRQNTLRSALILALIMCAAAWVIFHLLLKVQLPLFQWGA